MSINFSLYGDLASFKADRMSTSNLEVGQKVVRIHRPRVHFGTVLGEFRTSELTVKKILKTRVVFEKADGRELRMLVETGAWTLRAGEVKTDEEGNTQSWNREPVELATADEVEIIEAIRQNYADRKAEQDERNALKEAIAEVRHELDGNADLAKIDAAIEALTKLRNKIAAQA
jgi:hypothetical protein